MIVHNPLRNADMLYTNFMKFIFSDAPDVSQQSNKRGKNKGRDLDRISRALSCKIPIQISEGKKRPDAPMQAAKLASEGGIILRQHIPVLPHWKEYKNDQSHLTDYIGKVAVSISTLGQK